MLGFPARRTYLPLSYVPRVYMIKKKRGAGRRSPRRRGRGRGVGVCDFSATTTTTASGRWRATTTTTTTTTTTRADIFYFDCLLKGKNLLIPAAAGFFSLDATSGLLATASASALAMFLALRSALLCTCV